MSIQHTFTCKKDSAAKAHTFKAEMPSSIDDADLIVRRYGSARRMVEVANTAWTVACQTGIRKRLPDLEKAQGYVDNFCHDGSKDTFVPSMSKDEATKHGFTPEQLAALKAKGMKIDF